MGYASTTTLQAIRDAGPCVKGWEQLLAHLGKTKADDEPLDLITVLNSNGLDDALWVLSYAMPDDRLARHFQALCARQVLHLFENAHPGDMRIRHQIEMLENDAAIATEGRDAWAVAGDAAKTAEWAAERAAAGAVTWDAWVVEVGHARAAQESQLRKVLGPEA